MGRPMKPWFRPGRGWYVEVDGKQERLTDKDGTEGQGVRAMHALLARRGIEPRTQVQAAEGMSVEEVCLAYLDHAKVNLKPLTYDFYVRHLKPFSQVHAKLPTRDLRPHHVTAWVAAKEWSNTTRRGAITAVKRAFHWAKRQGMIPDNPIGDTEKPPASRRETIPDRAEVDAILAEIKDRPFRDLLLTIHDTGCRPGEASVVTASDIDFTTNTWTLANKTEHATGRKRVVHMTDRVAGICRRLATENPRGPIFRNTRGNPWTRNAMACRFDELRRKKVTGKDGTAVAFRHLFITDSLEKEIPVATVAELVGHVDTGMISRVYSKLSARTAYLQDALKKVRGDDQKP